MKVLCTYHPASILHPRPVGNVGPTKESLLRAIQDDIARAAGGNVKSIVPPLPGPLGGLVVGVDTEYPNGEMTTVAVATNEGMLVWDNGSTRKKCACGQDTYDTPWFACYACRNADERIFLTTEPKRDILVTEEGKEAKKGKKQVKEVKSGALTSPAEVGVILVPQEVIGKILKNADVLIGHSMAEDVRFLWEAGLIPKEEKYLTGKALVDTLLVAKMAYEGRTSYKLEDLLAEFYTVEGWKRETRGKKPWDWTPEERARRCQLDAWATYMVAKSEWAKVDRKLYGFTVRYAMTLHRMTLAGSIVDKTTYHNIAQSVENQRNNLLDKLKKAGALLGKGNFDPSNDHHLRAVLYDTLAIPITSRTPKAKLPSVDRATLESLVECNRGGTKGFLEALVEFSKVDKLYTTYTEGLNSLIHWGEDRGWLPFNFITLGARTGRRSSVNPNSQNWPVAMRQMVRSRYPGGLIMEFDYAKLEPRIIGYLAKCDKLLSYFTVGGGYLDVARELFRTEVKAGTPLYVAVKSIVLGVHYGMQTDLMAEELWQEGIRFGNWEVHWAETDRIRNLYLQTFPEIEQYMARCEHDLATTGTVTGPTGRTLHLGGDGKHSKNQAINGPIQGTASDITGSALIDVETALLLELGISLPDWFDLLCEARRNFLTTAENGGIMRSQWEVPVLFNEVHDSLVLDVPKGEIDKTRELCVAVMRGVPTIRGMVPYLKDLPLDVDVKIGPTWGAK